MFNCSGVTKTLRSQDFYLLNHALDVIGGGVICASRQLVKDVVAAGKTQNCQYRLGLNPNDHPP